MSSTTPNLGLTKTTAAETIGQNWAASNDSGGNFDIIDTKMGAVGNTPLQTQINTLSSQINTLSSKLGYSDISQHDVTDLNSALPSGAGVYFFTYSNTASNRPSTAGGSGMTLCNGLYGIQISSVNRGSDGNTFYYRNFWDYGNSFGTWRLVTSTT